MHISATSALTAVLLGLIQDLGQSTPPGRLGTAAEGAQRQTRRFRIPSTLKRGFQQDIVMAHYAPFVCDRVLKLCAEFPTFWDQHPEPRPHLHRHCAVPKQGTRRRGWGGTNDAANNRIEANNLDSCAVTGPCRERKRGWIRLCCDRDRARMPWVLHVASLFYLIHVL
jgi:hypothetical protein